MKRSLIWRELPATVRLLAVALLLGVFAAGCSSQSSSTGASVQSCTAAGVAAVEHHVTLTAQPAACEGLTQAQVGFAVGAALHSAAIGVHGKAAQRARMGAASRYLKNMIVGGSAAPSQKPVLALAGKGVSGTALGIAALLAWLVTIGLGLLLLIRWMLHARRAGRSSRPSALKLGHLGLAVVGLLFWIAYLGVGTAGLAWVGCAMLAGATGFGMALVALLAAGSPARGTGGQPLSAPTVPTVPTGGEAAGGPPRGGQGRRSVSLIVTVGAHVAFALLTIVLAVLSVAA